MTQVFISYAKEDKVFAEKFYLSIQQSGIKPWLDSVDLVPGQNWDVAIKKAIKDSRYFIALLSSRSVRKKGYVQKEIRQALKIAEEYTEDEVYIIPVRIDECQPSFEGLLNLHWADLFPDYEKGIKGLLRAFKYESEEKPTLNVDSEPKEGTITRLSDRAFGYVRKFGLDIFFHHSELKGITFGELRVGDSVSFKIATDPKGKIFATEVMRC
jgi:cold shock CspA family protein